MAPLTGHRVIELAGLGPAPFTGMMLADMGAEVIRIDRVGGKPALGVVTPLDRGRRSVGIDVRTERGLEILLRLAETADVLIEPFRPGVAERLGFGPKAALAANPGLVYGRMTGWGQTGPLAHTAGHDINYIALAGILGAVGRREEAPVPPLNLIGDFGGGGMLLTCGLLAALLERSTTGRGQVVDAAMVDGSALLMAMIYGMRAAGTWSDERGTNVLDGGAPFYDTYRTRDDRWVAVGAIEPQFFAALVAGLGLAGADLPRQYDRARWPELRARFADAFVARTRAEWVAHFDGSDACVTPVLSMAEAADHPHNVARGTFRLVDGSCQPAPAPRFGVGDPVTPGPVPVLGADTQDVLTDVGYAGADLDVLRADGVIS